jgi:hypothetical protein
MRDLISNIKSVFHLGGAFTTTQTPGTGVDLKGFDSCLIQAAIGPLANVAASPSPSWTFTLQESDSATTGFTAVASGDVILANGHNDGTITSGVFGTVNSSTKQSAVFTVGYIGSKRYIRVVATAAQTPGTTAITVVVALGHAHQQPTAD